MKHEFLSPEWIAAAQAVRDEYKGRIPAVGLPIRLNLVINQAPGDTTIEAHIDTSSGQPNVELGLLAAPDVTLTLDYATAKAAFADADQAAVMQSFMSGRIKVDGDLAKLLAMQAQQAQAGALAAEIANRVREITAD